MNFLVDNWYILIAAAAVIAFAAILIYNFVKYPRSEQLKKVQQWLLYAVTEAEMALGGGTGQLKLRYVYNMFITRFPAISKVISFDTFSSLVDKALEKMRYLLETNDSVKKLVQEEISYGD